MDFSVPDEYQELLNSFRSFLDREVAPVEERYRIQLQEEDFTDDMREAGLSLRRRSADLGFYAAHMPESVGGWGLSNLGYTLLVEEGGKSGLRFGSFVLGPPNPEAPNPILMDLPQHLHPKYVEPLVRGETTMCFALTEPEAGSDAQAIRTRAVRDGDSWVLNGTKHYITNADRADFAVAFAVTDEDKRAHGGITAFVVPRGAYTVGKKQHTIADTHPFELVLEDARIPADHVIGEVGFGFYSAMKFLNSGRAYIGAQCLGMAEWCLEQAVEHARSRVAFGKPIGRFQGVAFPLADCKVEIEAMRWLTYHLAWLVDQAEANAGGPDSQPILQSSIVKYFNTERAYAVADRCLQVFGGQGLLKEGPIEAVLRHLRMLRVVEGASEIQKLVISRSLGL
jgi:acyl-CoA dehydrogenase